MNARVYLNTSTLAATARIDGGGFSPPAVRAYSDVIFRFRLAREIEGESVPDDREITSVSARIGYQDSEPTSGTVTLSITHGVTTVTTSALAYNATAAQVKAAIDASVTATAISTLGPCTCEDTDEGYRIIFALPAETVTVVAGSNKLWPSSFVNADRIAFDAGWATLLAYRQAPVAEVDTAEETVPGAPTVTSIQVGDTTDGVSINEIQKITLNPAYSGATWRLVWDGIKGSVLPGFPTVEQLQESLDGLAPDGGIFTLLALEDGVLVEFAGSMVGEPWDLMTTEEFTPPPTEWLVKLSTATAAMRTMMAGAGTDNEIELPMDITVTVTDDDAPGGEQKINFPLELTFTRPVSDDARNVSAALNWTQPLSRTSNAPFSTSSLLVGNRAMRFTIGDASATSFALAHNLGSVSATFTANASTEVCTSTAHNLHNGDPVTVSSTTTLPAGLSAGVTYYVISATANTFQLSATPGGSAVNITDTGTGTHSFLVADGTTDAVFVEVWEKGGGLTRVSNEDYTVTRTSANLVTVSGFASTPTLNQYEVIVMTAGRPATYQAHTHTIAEVLLLQAALDSIGERLTVLEALAPSGVTLARSTTTGGALSRNLGTLWRVPRARTIPTKPDTLMTWKTSAEELGELPRRPLRLLPAVHDAATETLPAAPLPAAASAYAGRVFSTAADRTDFPGGLLAGDFAACDGREWYRVAKEASGESSYYPTVFNMEFFRTTVNASQLTAGTVLNLLIGFEASIVMLDKKARAERTAASYTFLIESGVQTTDASPGTPGANSDEYFNTPVIMVSQRIDLTEVPSQHRFGISVTRPTTGAITATGIKYLLEAAATAPASAEFVIRARLCRFDTENDPTDAKGIVAIRGLDVGLDGSVDTTLGLLTIG